MSGNPARGGRGGRGGGGSRGGRGGGDGAPRGGYQGGSGDRGRGGAAYQGRGGPRGGGHGGHGGYGGQAGLPIRAGTPHSQAASDSNSTTGPPAGLYQLQAGEKPDEDAIKIENDRFKPSTVKAVDSQFPRRPGYGTGGRSIVLAANYFRLKTNHEDKKPDVALFRYSISIADSLTRPRRHRLVELILQDARFNGIAAASDYAGTIVTNKALDLGPSQIWEDSTEVNMADEDPRPTGQAPESGDQPTQRNKRFKIEPNGQFSLAQLVEYLKSSSPTPGYAAKDEVIQLLNIIIGGGAHRRPGVYKVGADNKFYTDSRANIETMDLTGGLRALRGYYASVRPATGRILLNVNVVSGAFYKPIPVTTIVNQFCDTPGGPRSYPRGREQLWKLERFLRLLKVDTGYLPKCKPDGSIDPTAKAKKVKVIFSLARDFKNAHEATFKLEEANGKSRMISVFDYFKQHHKIVLQNPLEPVLNVGNREKPVLLPMELCSVVVGQAVRKMLAPAQTSAMIQFAARAPNQNAHFVGSSGLSMFGLDAAAQPGTVNPFGLSVNTRMITVPARILPPPNLGYEGQMKNVTPRDGSWNLANKSFVKSAANFPKWALVEVNIGNDRYGYALDQRGVGAKELCEEILRVMRQYGRTILPGMPDRCPVNIPGTGIAHRRDSEQAIAKHFENLAQRHANVALVVLKEADRWLYSRIKFYGDVIYGIHTICAVGNKLQKPKGQDMYIGNLALKFNIKGGGINHVMKNAMAPLDEHTMLVGIDVTHPSPGSGSTAPSVAGVVANTDKYLAQWPASIRRQEGRKEMVTDIGDMIGERLALWRTRNQNRLPNKVIVYRDGVSEGQFQLVLDQELPGFHAAFKKYYGDKLKWPKMAVIIVSKRHHTRFYPTQSSDANFRNFNPLPGTVVDRGVTDAYLYDFFLQAHSGLQGSARPARYVVIKDELGFKADMLESFTHNLCYMFNRATKAVSICPPAYYADLLCERARMYLFSTLNEPLGSDFGDNSGESEWDGTIHPRIRDTTFYI